MPGAFGEELIGERLNRRRTELVRVRATIARHENNGQAHNIGGAAAITEIAYERALARERQISAEIAVLEARLNGGQPPNIAVTQTISRA